jgi:transketolase
MAVTATRDDLAVLEERARVIRHHVVTMARAAGGGYVGQGLSSAELMAALYFRELRHDPRNLAWPDRDRMLLSAAHYGIGVYAVMAELGVFARELLLTHCADDSPLEMIAEERTPGVEITGGSLGQGTSVGIGMALSAKLRGQSWRVYVYESDGPCEEGQMWEAALVAAHRKLDNLCLIVDANGRQVDGAVADILNIEPLAEKWRAFGWAAIEIDGHDLGQILAAFDRAKQTKGKPTVIVARTTMGKGVSFLETRAECHYVRWRPGEAERALAEIGALDGDAG